MSDDVLNSIIERVNGAADPQVKGLFINAINELTLHEKKVTSNLQKIKNALRPFTTQNRDKLVDCAIDLSEYAYQHIDHPNPFYLQKFCEFLLLRKEVDLVIEHIEAFIKHNKNNTERNSIEFITITLASAYSWKDKKYLVKAISLLEDLKSSSMRVKDNLAKLYYNNSNFDKVLELAESSGDMNSQLALWYGKSLFQLGKVNEAISALETFRHDKDVEKFLDQIRIQQRVFLPTINCKPAKVFISYSRIDTEYADKVVALLDQFGIEYFLDRKDIEWGGHITKEINKGLSSCDAVIVIVSPASLKSHWVPYEIGRAAGQDKDVLPLLTHPSLDLPGYMLHLNYITSLEQAKNYFEKIAQTAT